MFKKDFLKALGLSAAIAPLAVASAQVANAALEADPDALVGLWGALIKGSAGVYRYYYSISRGSYVATGNIDENYQGTKSSPTMGAYERRADGSYAYRERGYAFDLKGNDVGTFESEGTMRLSKDGDTLSGPGTFRQYDLHGKPLLTERFTMTATRIKV